MPDKSRGRARLTTVAIAMVMGLLGGLGGVAIAGHQFPDVPNSQAHHTNIGRIVRAGCATGFNDGTYKPGNNITRGQAAAQIVRCTSRVEGEDGSANGVADNTEAVVASVDIRNIATTGDGGFVQLVGTVSATETATNCPCTVRIEIVDDTSNATSGGHAVGFETPVLLGVAIGQASWNAVFPLPPGEQHNYDLVASGFSSGDNTIDLSGALTAAYFPLGGEETFVLPLED